MGALFWVVAGSGNASSRMVGEVDGPGSAADEETFRAIYGRSLTADDTMDKQAAL